MEHATVVDDEAAISGYRNDPKEVSANAFAAEFLMPKRAVAEWGREHVDGEVTLEDVVRLAYEYGVSAQAARYALETAGVPRSGRRCRQLDEEIAEGLHVDVAQRLGLEPLDDALADAARRLPRIPSALENSGLGDLLVGDIDVDGLAHRVGRTREEVESMLRRLQLDRLLPSAPTPAI
jgi:hypothetical protein